MYKPGTQLIMNELWAAAAARKLGFELDSGRIHWDKKTEFWNTGFSTSADKWRIPVTESGPNAAERFLPKKDDIIIVGVHPVRMSVNAINFFLSTKDFRIVERNNTPFPQFSEVIEP